jgi:hypothetical protein
MRNERIGARFAGTITSYLLAMREGKVEGGRKEAVWAYTLFHFPTLLSYPPSLCPLNSISDISFPLVEIYFN